MRRTAAVALTLAAVWAGFGGPIAVDAAPAATTSRYLSTISTTTLYNLGYAAGSAQESGVIILDFGRPKRVNGVFGTKLFNNAFATVTQIGTASKEFVRGWYNGSGTAPRLVLVIGTSNDNGDAQVGIGHGTAWANMVNDVQEYVVSQSYDWRVDTHGGSDMEPGFSPLPQGTRLG